MFLQDEEAKMQEEIHLRKKENEELERKRHIVEEKKKQEDRIAELNLKCLEEKLCLKQAEEEKEREKARLEKYFIEAF